MKTLKKVNIKPVFIQLIPDFLEENHVYISTEYNTAVHKCLCGCGNQSVTPLNNANGWIISLNNELVSFQPSILNTFCNTHYIITNNVANFC